MAGVAPSGHLKKKVRRKEGALRADHEGRASHLGGARAKKKPKFGGVKRFKIEGPTLITLLTDEH